MEQATGFEPALSAWKADVLPIKHYACMWRGRWDSNPRALLYACRFSRPAPSTTWVLPRMVQDVGVEPLFHIPNVVCSTVTLHPGYWNLWLFYIALAMTMDLVLLPGQARRLAESRHLSRHKSSAILPAEPRRPRPSIIETESNRPFGAPGGS